MTGQRLALVSIVTAGWGAMLLFSRIGWFRRKPLAERLSPFHPGAHMATSSGLDASSFIEVIGPLARRYGSSLAHAVGLREDLEVRLARVHAPHDATTFRLRQLAWSVAGFTIGAVVTLAMGLPGMVGLALILGAALLGALIPEQLLATQSGAYQHRVFLELPVVAEQLASLLGAGYSLGAALGRLADRGNGAIARDLRGVLNRVHQGLSIDAALAEWAIRVDVEELIRLTHVLSLHRAATDLGSLIAQEAHAIRRENHRQLIARAEQRAQMVWIPVTVAALLPGAIFLAVPFIDALHMVSG